MSLQGKKILFIAPVFHDYHLLIIEKLQEMGAEVAFFPERDYSILFKMTNHFFHPLLPVKQFLHYQKIARQVKKRSFDYLFVIRGYGITEKFVRQFKKQNPLAKTVMYQWDSNRTNPYSHIISCFDVVQSFDYKDCASFKIPYLPLFYTDDVIAEASRAHTIKYDFFFMGTYLPARYRALLRFREKLQDVSRLKAFIYIPSSSLKKEQLKGVKLDMDIVSTCHMPREKYLKLLNESRVVVDVSDPRQTGLAMRIIEALASHRKILTVNRFITGDPYYDPQNIALFDENDPIFDDSFVRTPFSGNAPVLALQEWLLAALAIESL